MSGSEQLAALARLHDLFEQAGIDHWLFGGWAVDFHLGAVTRAHDDLDIAVWLRDTTLGALRSDKSEPHDDPAARAKDRADLAALARLG